MMYLKAISLIHFACFSVERLFYQLCKSGHPTLDPLILTQDEIMTIREDKITNPQSLATLLNGHR